MGERSERFGLPMIASGQAQKEVTHNEAIAAVGGLMHLAIESRSVAVPPHAPATGTHWIVPAGGEGAWIGAGGRLATWTGGGWLLRECPRGTIGWIVDEAIVAVHDGTAWNADFLPVGGLLVDGEAMFGAARTAIPDPAGGTVVDTEARGAIFALLAALRDQGVIAR